MYKLYHFFGGRKLYYFNFMFIVNLILILLEKWDEGFGFFSIGLYATIVLGIEGGKYVKTKEVKGGD